MASSSLFRALGSDIFETVVNKSESVKDTKKTNVDDLTPKEKKEYKSKRKRRLIQEKLIKFATRVPAFMYLTDFRGDERMSLAKTTDFVVNVLVTALSKLASATSAQISR